MPQVLPSILFREELEREMLLSDRTEMPLTLLLFDLVDAKGMRAKSVPGMRKLAEVIAESTRRSDVKGWFHDTSGLHLGVMMSNTACEKIGRTIACIRESFSASKAQGKAGAEDEIFVSCEVYAYPGNGLVQDDDYEQTRLFETDALAGPEEQSAASGGAERISARRPSKSCW